MLAGAHDHEDQSAETGDRLGRVFGLKIRIGRTKTNAHGNNSGNEAKNGDGGQRHHKGSDGQQNVGEDDQDLCQYQQWQIIDKKLYP